MIGINSLHGEVAPIPVDENTVNEVGFRCTAKLASKKDAYLVRRFVMTGALCAGPVGTAFNAPQKEREIVALWPALIPRDDVKTTLTMMEVV